MVKLLIKLKLQGFLKLDLFSSPISGNKVVINESKLLNILVIDCGTKIVGYGFTETSSNDGRKKNTNYGFGGSSRIHGIFISNGPGDP